MVLGYSNEELIQVAFEESMPFDDTSAPTEEQDFKYESIIHELNKRLKACGFLKSKESL